MTPNFLKPKKHCQSTEKKTTAMIILSPSQGIMKLTILVTLRPGGDF